MLKINDREKKLLIVLGALISALGLYFLIISPLIDLKKNSDEIYNKNRLKINRLDDIYSQYRDILTEKSKLNAIAAGNTGIGAKVDEIATGLGIIGNKVYLKETPGNIQNNIQKMTTEVKFEGISIKALMEFLNKIESSNIPLKIQNLVIYSGIKERSRYDSVITIVSLTRR
jgi:type II secretory pathway component PulM